MVKLKIKHLLLHKPAVNICLRILCIALTLGYACCRADAATAQAARRSTVLAEMKRLQETRHIHFVYDSALDLNVPYNGPETVRMPLVKALDMLFSPCGIVYERHRNNVALRRGGVAQRVAATVACRPRLFAVSGRM